MKHWSINLPYYFSKRPSIRFILTVFIISFAVLFWGIIDRATKIDLLDHGSRGVGTIIDKKITYDNYDGEYYTIRYTFTGQDARLRTFEHDIPEKVWKALEIGSYLEIVYDPKSPAHNLPDYYWIADEVLRPCIVLSTIGLIVILVYLILKIKRRESYAKA